jgi:8-oxo-dGTP diphosphatase
VLDSSDMVAFVGVSDLAVARSFYGGVLGLPLVEGQPIAVVFDGHGTMLRVTLVDDVAPVAYTVLGWSVADIAAEVRRLLVRGVSCHRYPGLEQDELGVWTTPGGDKVAWFADPDGNTLSLTEFVGVPAGLPAPRWVLPRLPASASALVFDRKGRLLVLEPTYKAHWTLPGGMMEADGESPWEACRREVQEETGLELDDGRLVAVDYRRPRSDRPGGLRYLFACGRLSDRRLAGITLQADELAAYRLVGVDEAQRLLSKPLRRRLAAALAAKRRRAGTAVELVDGRPRRRST